MVHYKGYDIKSIDNLYFIMCGQCEIKNDSHELVVLKSEQECKDYIDEWLDTSEDPYNGINDDRIYVIAREVNSFDEFGDEVSDYEIIRSKGYFIDVMKATKVAEELTELYSEQEFIFEAVGLSFNQ